jgi:hypothetical protein
MTTGQYAFDEHGAVRLRPSGLREDAASAGATEQQLDLDLWAAERIALDRLDAEGHDAEPGQTATATP